MTATGTRRRGWINRGQSPTDQESTATPHTPEQDHTTEPARHDNHAESGQKPPATQIRQAASAPIIHTRDQFADPIIAAVRRHYLDRLAAMKIGIKIQNAAKAGIAAGIGYTSTMSKAERDDIWDRAALVLREKPRPGDEPIVERFALRIAMTKSAMVPINIVHDETERDMADAARQLPIWDAWASKHRGFGIIGFATLVGEAGDMTVYKNPAALWKRLGLAVMDGRRQGNPGENATAEDWIKHGYNAQRRSRVFAVFEPMVRHQTAWREREAEPARDGKKAVKARKGRPAGPWGEVMARKKMEYTARVIATEHLGPKDPNKWTPMRAQRAAMRYLSKQVLKHLWLEWMKLAYTMK